MTSAVRHLKELSVTSAVRRLKQLSVTSAVRCLQQLCDICCEPFKDQNIIRKLNTLVHDAGRIK